MRTFEPDEAFDLLTADIGLPKNTRLIFGDANIDELLGMVHGEEMIDMDLISMSGHLTLQEAAQYISTLNEYHELRRGLFEIARRCIDHWWRGGQVYNHMCSRGIKERVLSDGIAGRKNVKIADTIIPSHFLRIFSNITSLTRSLSLGSAPYRNARVFEIGQLMTQLAVLKIVVETAMRRKDLAKSVMYAIGKDELDLTKYRQSRVGTLNLVGPASDIIMKMKPILGAMSESPPRDLEDPDDELLFLDAQDQSSFKKILPHTVEVQEGTRITISGDESDNLAERTMYLCRVEIVFMSVAAEPTTLKLDLDRSSGALFLRGSLISIESLIPRKQYVGLRRRILEVLVDYLGDKSQDKEDFLIGSQDIEGGLSRLATTIETSERELVRQDIAATMDSVASDGSEEGFINVSLFEGLEFVVVLDILIGILSEPIVFGSDYIFTGNNGRKFGIRKPKDSKIIKAKMLAACVLTLEIYSEFRAKVAAS